MATDFPIMYFRNPDASEVLYFTPDAAETIVVHDLVYVDTADVTGGNLKRCGADPTLILGRALSRYPALEPTGDLYEGRLPVEVISPAEIFGMCSATTPIRATHVGNSYGIVRLASGSWAVDTTEAVNTRVLVVSVDEDNGIFWVRFLAANLQGDAIAS